MQKSELMMIREEEPGDREAVRRVNADAFGREHEAGLVDDLRDHDDLVISLVAEEDGGICGHVALSRLGSPPRALALAPVSVLTRLQRRGIGSALVRRSLERARELGYQIVFVLGEPGYYTRFGFSSETAATFPCRYAGPCFMALCLTDNLPEPAQVVYARAFDELA